MSKKQSPGNTNDKSKHALLFCRQLEEASLRMELLKRCQVAKSIELARVSKELEEMKKMYKSYKPKKRRFFL